MHSSGTSDKDQECIQKLDEKMVSIARQYSHIYMYIY